MIRISKLRNRRYLSLFGIVAVLALLASTLQIPVSTHWCGGKIFNRGVYAEASPCAMNAHMEESAKSFSRIPCCSNETQLLAASGLDFNLQTTSIQDFSKTLEFVAPANVIWMAFPLNKSSNIQGLPQGPPTWTVPDLFDLYQSYLI